MDGVLTDSEPLISAAAMAMFKEKGLTVQAEDFLPFVGAGEDRYIGGVAEKYNFPVDVSSAKKRTYEIYLEQVPSGLEAFPGAVELVRACRNAGLKVAVASSADRIKTDANLKKIGLPPEMWDAIVTAEDVAHKKPAPDIHLASARKLGLSPERCVAIEDAVSGVQAAKAAGMRCVAVAQTFPPEQLQAADLIRKRISEVTLADLTCEPESVGISVPPPAPIGVSPELGKPEPMEPRPWGFWATLGLGLLVAAAFVGASQLAFVLFLVLAPAWGIEVSPETWRTNGLLWTFSVAFSAPAMLGFTWLFARLRRGIRVGEYLALKRA